MQSDMVAGSEEGYGVCISNDGTMYLNGHFSKRSINIEQCDG